MADLIRRADAAALNLIDDVVGLGTLSLHPISERTGDLWRNPPVGPLRPPPDAQLTRLGLRRDAGPDVRR